MNVTPLIPIILFGSLTLCLAEPSSKSQEAIQSYTEILDILPEEMEPWNARHWSAETRVAATEILRDKVIKTKRPISMKIRAEKPQAWPGLTLYVPLPNNEGYPVHLFMGLFEDDDTAAARLASITPGDWIQVDGYFQALSFRTLWGRRCLNICIEEGTITPLQRNKEPKEIELNKEIKVYSSVYGSGEHFKDVTKRVKRLLQEPSSKFYVRPHWLGVSPATKSNRSLVITYRWKGKKE